MNLLSLAVEPPLVATSRDRAVLASIARLASRIATALFVVTMIGIAAAGVAYAMGYRPMAVTSGSMTPTLRTGDLIVTRMVEPSAVDVGDVVTFHYEPLDDLVTHRVVATKRTGTTYEFTTKGDANTVTETWTLPADGRLGSLVTSVEHGGRVLVYAGYVARIALIGAALVAFGIAMRRIWR